MCVWVGMCICVWVTNAMPYFLDQCFREELLKYCFLLTFRMIELSILSLFTSDYKYIFRNLLYSPLCSTSSQKIHLSGVTLWFSWSCQCKYSSKIYFHVFFSFSKWEFQSKWRADEAKLGTAHPATIVMKRDEKFNITHSTVLCKLKNIGKDSVILKWIPHDLCPENL